MTGTPVIFFSFCCCLFGSPAGGSFSRYPPKRIAPQRLTELPLRAALRRSVASSRLAALKGDFRSAKGAGLADKCNSFGRVPRKPHAAGSRVRNLWKEQKDGLREMPHPLMLLSLYKRKTRCCSNGFFRERTPNINTLRRGISHSPASRHDRFILIMPRDLPGPQRA